MRYCGALLLILLGPVFGQTAAPAARIAGKPNFNGVWEAHNTANWDLQTHEAHPMVGQQGLTPGSTVLFRYRVVTRAGETDWSEPASLIVK